jgi:hypothetical protein
MTLENFKTMIGCQELDFFASESGRYVASHGAYMLVTTLDFDSDETAYVVRAGEDKQDGKVDLYWLTNKEPKEAAFKL